MPRGLSTYRQGSAEYLTASREALLEPLPSLVPTAPEAVAEVEREVAIPRRA